MKKRRHPNTVIESLRRDRLAGSTIPELVQKYTIPKTTVWHNVRDIKLPEEVRKEILSRRGGSAKRKLVRITDAEMAASNLLRSTQREFAVAVAMLYWAEGHKKSFVFTNTDENMLKLYIRFLKSIFNIVPKDFRILIRTADPIVPKEALLYWSKTLDLPRSAFKVNHDSIQNRTKSSFGICRVMVVKSNYYHKIMLSLVRQIQADLLPL